MSKLKCHCGGVEIEVNLPNGLKNLVRCNCSICKRRSAVMGKVGPDDLKVTKGKELLSLYQFHSKTAKHYFCSVCGIYTHHNPRSAPSNYGFNVACLDDINPYDLKDVPIFDGINHPNDKK
tara:strand:+ start:4878 stop:5240 length:363 start_codon:yes stop_codon:yes gene_type:complete